MARAAARRSYLRDPDAIKARVIAYRATKDGRRNKLQSDKRYREKHQAVLAEKALAYFRTPAGKASRQRRAARQYVEHKAKIDARTYQWRKENPVSYLEYQRAHRYGLAREERQALLDSQGGRCAVCGTDKPTRRGWFLDHDHGFALTDRRGHRGIVCMPCNSILGLAKDDAGRLESAAAFLRRHSAKTAA